MTLPNGRYIFLSSDSCVQRDKEHERITLPVCSRVDPVKRIERLDFYASSTFVVIYIIAIQLSREYISVRPFPPKHVSAISEQSLFEGSYDRVVLKKKASERKENTNKAMRKTKKEIFRRYYIYILYGMQDRFENRLYRI